MAKGKVIILGSTATRIETKDGRTGATGQYLNETVVPAMALAAAGYEVVLATPDGKRPHIDEASDAVQHFDGDAKAYKAGSDYYARDPAMTNPRTLRSVIEEGLDNYAGVFAPGGQAPVVDLMQDPDAGIIIRHFHEKKKPTAFLCHGPMASVSAMPHSREFRSALIAGDVEKAREWAKGWQYAGYRMCVFSATEEKVIEDNILHAKLYFNMPDALRAAGAKVENTDVDFAPHVIEDRELITGQNPRSDHPIAAAFIAALDKAVAKAR